MPIYAYRCSSCGHAQDVLQKISDPLLTVCPACGASSFEKQVTAAGFQLKGSGWYVTDFRDGKGGAKPAADGGDKAGEPSVDKAADSKPAAGGDQAAPPAAPAAPAAPPAAAPAASTNPAPAAKPGLAAGSGS
jgi:putative FmdB family regulatory protein